VFLAPLSLFAGGKDRFDVESMVGRRQAGELGPIGNQSCERSQECERGTQECVRHVHLFSHRRES